MFNKVALLRFNFKRLLEMSSQSVKRLLVLDELTLIENTSPNIILGRKLVNNTDCILVVVENLAVFGVPRGRYWNSYWRGN